MAMNRMQTERPLGSHPDTTRKERHPLTQIDIDDPTDYTNKITLTKKN
jgi:hypothetical protein